MGIKIKDIIIAFDGHSSCGKSTVAKEIAKKLSYTYIDSGAMYRVVTLWAMRHNLVSAEETDETGLKKILEDLQITFEWNNSGMQQTFMNGENVEKEIRSIEVSNLVSYISEIGFVREKMVKLQQEIGRNKRIVMDGRDIGTVVFPDAELKIFMTASPKVRAERRFKELIARGDNVSFDQVLANIEKRDHIDQNREISPLKKAEDALVLDNSFLSREEQLEWVLGVLKERFGY
jgi:CMP/dCMP kinase